VRRYRFLYGLCVRVLRLGRGDRRLGDRLVVGFLATEGAAEIAEPFPERTTDLRKPLRAEHQQRHHQDEKKMRRLKDVPDHDLQA
jgi:hypothetical protein